ncbi:MAG: helix-turn-helix domain-containing protein [Candidatus Woesearchaeota archaeon]|jgi:sugar-specific transcriptional regulator TrmB
MEDILEQLHKAGLTGNESKIYLNLLKQGPLAANELAKNIGMDRTLAYTVLNNLLEKGMISYITKDHKKIFKASKPDNLLNPIKKQEALIETLVSTLKKIEKSNIISQEINVYEGKDGLRALLREMYDSKEICSFGATGKLYESLYEIPHILKAYEKQKIKGRLIYSNLNKNNKIIPLKNTECRFLPTKSETTTTIFNDKIAIHMIIDKPLIIIIKNKLIAESYKSHFEILWNIAKPINLKKIK